MIDDELKEKYNVLITCERKYRLKAWNDGSYQQQYFYLDKKGKKICSSRTYCRLEQNEIRGEDDLYIFLASKLDKSIKHLPKIDELLQKAIHAIFIHMERLEETSAADVIQAILPRLDECENVLYYEEYVWQFEMIKNYFRGSSHLMDEYQFERIIQTFSIYPKEYQDILMRFAYLYSNFKEVKKKENVFELYDFEHSAFLCNQFTCIQKEILNQDKYKALLRCIKLEERLKDKKNYVQLFTLYIHLFSLLVEFDKKEARHYIEKTIELTKLYDFHQNRLLMLHANAGGIYLLMHEYEKSIEHFKKNCEVTDRTRMRNYLCICHCFHMLDKEIPMEYKTCPPEHGDSIDKIVYDFYVNEDNSNYKQKINYIMNKVSRKLSKNDNLYLQIMKEELHLLAMKTNHYKSLYIFCDKFEL